LLINRVAVVLNNQFSGSNIHSNQEITQRIQSYKTLRQLIIQLSTRVSVNGGVDLVQSGSDALLNLQSK
jgi:hypothetical protein